MIYLYWTVLVLVYSLHLASTQDKCSTCRPLVMGESFSLDTPNYPYLYNGVVSCHWRFSTPVKTIVQLECRNFNIRKNESGCIDAFQFSPSGDLTNADDEDLCGSSPYFTLYTTSNYFDAYFNSEPTPIGMFGPPVFHHSTFECRVSVIADRSPRQDCGKNKLPSRIIEGDVVTKHEWPWQVALRAIRMKSSEPHAVLCGGSLISPSWVLTAAHCVWHYRLWNSVLGWQYRLDKLYVSIGDHNTDTGDDTPYTVQRYVSNIIVHGHYIQTGIFNDIALLQLENPVDYSHGIVPVCLPNNQPAQSFLGENATVTGWGQTSTYGPLSSNLRAANIRIVPNNNCDKASWMNGGGTIGVHEICAYDEEQNGCYGDSGGPLVWKDEKGNYQQIGIVSRGTSFKCVDENDEPGVYTRVTSYVNWIQTNTMINICSN